MTPAQSGTDGQLYLKLVTDDAHDRELLVNLYTEAFPPEEWQPKMMDEIKNAAPDVWKTDEYLIQDGDTTVGLICVVHSEHYAYLLYLAISPRCQGGGYGSRVMTLFKNMYPHHIRFFDLEAPDASAPNAEQRIRRIKFYERNGYHMANYEIVENGVRLAFMTDSDTFEITEELQLLADS